MTIVPLDPPARIDLDTLAPLVRELSQWLDPDPWPAPLVGLIRSAPAGLLADLRAKIGRRRGIAVPWTLAAIVRHALLPLAELSLMDGQPMIPPLGAALVDVLADPRLGARLRRAVERVLIESEDREGELDADARGDARDGCGLARPDGG